MVIKQKGTKDEPWILKTPPGTSEFKAYRDPIADPPTVVVWVGKTELKYQLRCLDDLHKMLKEKGDWMPLGSADEQKPAAEGTLKLGVDHLKTQWVDGMGSKKGCEDGLQTIYRQSLRF